MKGFKKDGKFIPTGNKSKSNLKKSDVTKKVSSSSGVGHEMRNKKQLVDPKVEMNNAQEDFGETTQSVTTYMLSNGIPISSIKEMLHDEVEDTTDMIQHLHETGRLDVYNMKYHDKDMFREKESLEKKSPFFVEIFNIKTGEIDKKMPVLSLYGANKLEMSVEMRMMGNYDYDVRIVRPSGKDFDEPVTKDEME